MAGTGASPVHFGNHAYRSIIIDMEITKITVTGRNSMKPYYKQLQNYSKEVNGQGNSNDEWLQNIPVEIRLKYRDQKDIKSYVCWERNLIIML